MSGLPGTFSEISMAMALSWVGNFTAVLASVMLIVALFSEMGAGKNRN
jgi:hypothetical protein